MQDLLFGLCLVIYVVLLKNLMVERGKTETLELDDQFWDRCKFIVMMFKSTISEKSVK